jgi:hypothetical protein
MKKTWLRFVIGLALTCQTASGQVSVRDSAISFTYCAAGGGISLPGGNLKERFGHNFQLGLSFSRKLSSNWLFGIEGSFLFGDQVKDRQFLVDLATSQGYLITKEGTYGDVLLYERGYQIMAKAGKIIPVVGPNPNSGIMITAGAGFLQHKIRIENQGTDIPYLEGEYLKGYDRLTNGWCLSGFAGYANFGNRRRVNFYLGLEYTAGFTQSRRDFDFDTRQKDERKRTDILFGIRAGWIIPLYKKIPNAYYFD